MTPHWTERQESIRQWIQLHPRVLIGCDFDGTLSPLVSHAAEAVLLPASRSALLKLSKLDRVVVAIISGRAIADLQSRVGIPDLYYSGNHGLEMLVPGEAECLAPNMPDCLPALRAAILKLSSCLGGMSGVWIEDKGLTATVHYRLAEPCLHHEVGALVMTAMSPFHDLHLRPGKYNWEIRPAVAWNKGTALIRFMEHCQLTSQACAFMGDDVTDYDAFAVLPDGLTFIVGEPDSHQAMIRTIDPHDTSLLLTWMAETCADCVSPHGGQHHAA